MATNTFSLVVLSITILYFNCAFTKKTDESDDPYVGWKTRVSRFGEISDRWWDAPKYSKSDKRGRAEWTASSRSDSLVTISDSSSLRSGNSSSSSNSSTSSGSSTSDSSSTKDDSDESIFDLWNFSLQPSMNASDVPNLEMILQLQNYSLALKNQGKEQQGLVYRNLSVAIRNYNKTIKFIDELEHIPGVGVRAARKLSEILQHGYIRRFIELYENEKQTIVKNFSSVWGAGKRLALSWYNQGFRTVDELKACRGLTRYQIAGIKYFYDFKTTIPRHEVEEVADIVKTTALRIDKNLKFTICGTYRRGYPFSGETNIVITSTNTSAANLLYTICCKLEDIGLITDHLTNFDVNGINERKYLGVYKLPKDDQKHHRIILFLALAHEAACAILFNTGPTAFTNEMFSLASSLGMRLTSTSLRDNVKRTKYEVIDEGNLVPTPTEKSIFKALGMAFIPPERRD